MKLTTRQVVVSGILGSLTVVLGLLPVGGFIPVPTPAGSATTMHIPAILAGIIEGPVVGGFVGAIFGAFSFYRAFISPNPVVKMIFTNPLIAFLPRILIGILSYFGFQMAENRWGRTFLVLAGGTILGYTGYWTSSRIGGPGDGARETWNVIVGIAAGILGAVILHIMARRKTGGAPLGALLGSMTNTVGVLGLAVAFRYIPPAAGAAVGVLHGIPEALVAMVLATLVHSGVRSARIHR